MSGRVPVTSTPGAVVLVAYPGGKTVCYRDAELASMIIASEAQISGKAPLMREGAPNGTAARREPGAEPTG